MKVISVETYVLQAVSKDAHWRSRTWSTAPGRGLVDYPPVSRRPGADTVDTVLVRVVTEDGVEGWGEAKAPVGARATAAILDDLIGPIVIGTTLDEITRTWDRMYAGMRVRGDGSGFWLEVIAGVDIALWDAWGRTLGRPVSALVGGRYRDSVPVYASSVPGAPPGSGTTGQDAVRAEAERIRDQGFDAVKVAIGMRPEDDIRSLRTVREVFGETAGLYADAAGHYELPQALHVGSVMADLGVGFFEMPLPPEDLDGYTRLANRLQIPLALGGAENRHRAAEFMRCGAVHVLQPDVCRAGGISEVMRIATLADGFGAHTTPHASNGSAVHVAASLQCAGAIPNLAVFEHNIGENELLSVVEDPPSSQGEPILVPSSPGLGVAIDETAVARLS